MRVFIALPLGDDFKRAVLAAFPPLGPDRDGRVRRLRRVRPEGMHVTLAFLGELDTPAVEAAVQAARSAAAHAAAAASAEKRVTGPFELVSSSLILFPPRGRAMVVAAGIGQGSAESAALADALETALETTGRSLGMPFRPREARPFTPHVTLARADRPGVVLGAEERSVRFEARCIVDRMTVYRSLIEPGGARYESIGEIPLGRRVADGCAADPWP
jgi:RNA 2',3'-cyclic 3'-phosphodiesterase